MNLVELIQDIKNKLEARNNLGESATKQAFILPILQSLGWDIFNPDEVYPEFSIGNKRVDYCLRLNNQNVFFIEVKKTNEELDTHQEQLLEYAFRQGIELAALTNGMTWYFYLPMEKGSWNARKFYTINIIKQKPSEIATHFQQILSKEQVKSKNSIKYAKQIYIDKFKKEITSKTLPEAWNQIVSEPDELLIELLSEITEKICGFQPTKSHVRQFIQTHKHKLLLEIPSTLSYPQTTTHKKRPQLSAISTERFFDISELLETDLTNTKPTRLKINEEEYEVGSWADVDIKFVKWLVNNRLISTSDLPIHSSREKYFINSTNSHSSPKLKGSWKLIDDGFWVDIQYNANTHIKNIYKTLGRLHLKKRIKISLQVIRIK